MVIPNHIYLILKMLAPKNVISIFGNIGTSYNCDIEAVQLENSIMMIVESMKVD
jgi:hypothetical protein